MQLSCCFYPSPPEHRPARTPWLPQERLSERCEPGEPRVENRNAPGVRTRESPVVQNVRKGYAVSNDSFRSRIVCRYSHQRDCWSRRLLGCVSLVDGCRREAATAQRPAGAPTPTSRPLGVRTVSQKLKLRGPGPTGAGAVLVFALRLSALFSGSEQPPTPSPSHASAQVGDFPA